MAENALKDGRGLEKLREFIAAQGGMEKVIEDFSLFPAHTVERELIAEQDGYVQRIEARKIGLASQHTGAGRATKEEAIDLSAGVLLHKKIGDAVKKGEALATFYGNDPLKVDNAVKEGKDAFTLSENPLEPPILVKELIGL